MSAKLPVLPDGLLSHQNLYEAIHNIIKRPSSNGSLDLVGIQALQVLTGAASLGSLDGAPPEILVGESDVATVKPEKIATKALPQLPHAVIKNLASTYFGVTYNDALGTFGCINVLENHKIVPQLVDEPGDFEGMPNPYTLPRRSSEPENDRLQSHYSSDWAFRAAVSKKSECWILHRKTQIVVASNQRLSEDMQNLIRRLPPWSAEEQVKAKYRQFFTNYGTHVITRLVLGGTVRAIVDSINDGEHSVMIFRDGGASVAAELTVHLEQNFPPHASSPQWKNARDRWIQALEKEPVFCPDHKFAEFKAIHELLDPTDPQRSFLREGYQSYIAWRAQQDKNSDRKGSRTGHDSLQREFNLAQAVKLLLSAVTEALYRFREGR
ncbi:hypothetical protein C8F04DRAFT_1178401 [Mycena alexandri]|uniref:MACPF domain-containing protein n=1 Tax=Mycena alexandri TaxID=1745969 RepID=A0AAD6T9Y2_9AGAR|nr:hypothetical protein C8F04DRAFT_1178401 [Mycena alexandri]